MRHTSMSAGAIRSNVGAVRLPRAAQLFCLCSMCSVGSSAYSVLTHEEIVDLLWTDQIRPLLLKRYPG